MKIYRAPLIAMLLLSAISSVAAEYSRHTGRLLRDRGGAVLVDDDGNVYRVPGISRDFLDRHAGERITLVGDAAFQVGTGENRVIRGEEIIVTAPQISRSSESKSSGTKAAEAAQLIIPPLIPPL